MVTLDEIADFLAREFPQNACTVDAVGPDSATVRRRIQPVDLRPGGTVSGPVLFAVADCGLYIALFGALGITPMAVTSSMTMNFLRRPAADRDLLGKCVLLKTGRTLVVGEVSIYSEGQPEPVAHAVGTYALPRG
jgi:acyl-coenzyme A thioesterase PaaI-like protein